MSDLAREIIKIIRKRVNNAAEDSKAFEVGVISAYNGNGTVDVDVPGLGTMQGVGRLGPRAPYKEGQQVLSMRVSGNLQSMVVGFRSPYITGSAVEMPPHNV